MSNVERINQFLEDVYKAKKWKNISKNAVYSMLIFNDVDARDMNFDADANGFFQRWCEYFSGYNSKNIDVFVDSNWSYFCQFINNDKFVKSFDDQVKVYIPLDSAHLEDGVAQVFEFLKSNNICHKSKVGKEIRFDNVVVRLGTLQDAEKLSEFISSNPYIQDGLIKPNPFAVTKDGIAYACDKDISYNSTVAGFVNLYVDDVRRRKDHSNLGVEGFRNFIRSYYNEVIINPENYERLVNDFSISPYYSKVPTAYNYMRVAELLYKSLDPKFTYDDYKEYYNKNINNYYRDPELTYSYGDFWYDDIIDIGDRNPEDVKVEELMKKALIAFGNKTYFNGQKKFDNVYAADSIFQYVKDGDLKHIVASEGIRHEFHVNRFREKFINYASRYGVSFNDVVLKCKKQILEDSIRLTYDKYGESFNYNVGLENLINHGSYNGFTRDNNARSNMIAAVDGKDVSKIILKEMGYPSTVTFAHFNEQNRRDLVDQYISGVKEKIVSKGHGAR